MPLSPQEFSSKRDALVNFMKDAIYPAELEFRRQCREQRGRDWTDPPVLESLKRIAKNSGLWNLWYDTKLAGLSLDTLGGGKEFAGAGLSNLQYAELCE